MKHRASEVDRRDYSAAEDPTPQSSNMSTQSTSWPKKTRELHSHHFDSTIWNDLQVRDDDIVIATYAKAGTTWMQQIIAQLLFDGEPDLSVAEMSPWMDLRKIGRASCRERV